jgi:deoxyribodipyrimidine photo-lyase
MKSYKRSLVWFRRDLRLEDNHALSLATSQSEKVFLVFIYDQIILNLLEDKSDRRVQFLWDQLALMKKTGIDLTILYGDPKELIPKIVETNNIEAVYCNKDYEPYAKTRDTFVAKKLETKSCFFFQTKDQVIFESHEVLNLSGKMFQVFTPYKNAWLKKLLANTGREIVKYKVDLKKIDKLTGFKSIKNLKEVGFLDTTCEVELDSKKVFKNFLKVITDYKTDRDIPSLAGTSRLSVHLRFGTISVRMLVAKCLELEGVGAQTWLSELIWREFYMAILDQYPYVAKSSFKPAYDKIIWPGKKEHFKLWCAGLTGVPIVDAGMRELNTTGWMHNRVRMIVANYLIKILHIDWRLGEAYFAQKLIDFDLAANNGGWQWCASTGVDATPYFRIFNPYLQSEKFDPEGVYIKTYCPELNHLSGKELHRPKHTKTLVEYELARKLTSGIYSIIKN